MTTCIPDIPLDIISVIVDILRDTQRPDHDNSNSRFASSLRWIPEATHVCRSWRDAALSTSFLWTDIDVTASIPWALEFARRSGCAPLCILVRRSSGYPKVYKCVRTLVRENMQRIRKMAVRDSKKRFLNILSGGAHRTGAGGAFYYAILEDLEISLRSTTTISITNELRAPKLRRLSLVSLDLDFGSFHNLSHLSIIHTQFNIPASLLHRELSQMPNLETLVIDLDANLRAPLPSRSKLDPELPPAVLPKLHRIALSGSDINWVSAVLQAISFGPQRNVFVKSHGSYRIEQGMSLFSCIMSHAVESSDIRKLEISIPPLGPIPLSLNAWRDWTPKPDIGLSLFDLTQRIGPDFYLDGLLRRMNCQDLRFLRLDFPNSLSTRRWVELFGSLPSLAEIIINRGERELFGALVVASHTNDMRNMGGQAAGLSFRALKTIRTFKRSGLDVEFMSQCLRKRLDLGMGLKLLDVVLYKERCLTSEVVTEALKSVVEAVTVRCFS